MKGLFERFQLIGRKEKRVLQLLTDHFNMVASAVKELQSVLNSAKSGDWQAVIANTERVVELETLADSLHRQAVLAISEGAFFSGTREDFLELLEENDEIADAAKNAARILAETPIDDGSFKILYEETGSTVDDLYGKLLDTVQLLEQSLMILDSDAELAVSKSLLVEQAEEETDEIKNRLIKRVFAHKTELELLTLLQLRDFVLKLDEVADSAEDSSDIIISLAAKAEA